MPRRLRMIELFLKRGNYSVTRHALAAWLRARDENTQVVPILSMPQGNRHDVTVQMTEQLHTKL